MMTIKEMILDKLDSLSEPTLKQVLEFINQLPHASHQEEDDPLLSVIGILSEESISPNKIDQELYEE